MTSIDHKKIAEPQSFKLITAYDKDTALRDKKAGIDITQFENSIEMCVFVHE